MKAYKLSDVFKFAIKIERDGKKFYDSAVQLTRDVKQRYLFRHLSKEEVKHAQTFRKFYKQAFYQKVFFAADERLEGLLDGLARGIVIPDVAEIVGALKKSDNKVLTIIKVAMDVETNTILFYQEIHDAIKVAQAKQAFKRIIKEEKTHLVKLRNLRLDLDPVYAAVRYGKFF
ncbi:MAG: ferritin family protein [Planctomycetes bacterium]|nr:ferritin family protein [Planctomycetota bacterium]